MNQTLGGENPLIKSVREGRVREQGHLCITRDLHDIVSVAGSQPGSSLESPGEFRDQCRLGPTSHCCHVMTGSSAGSRLVMYYEV